MYGYSKRQTPEHLESRYKDKKNIQNTIGPHLEERIEPENMARSLPKRDKIGIPKGKPEDEQDTLLSYYANHLLGGLWKWLKRMPLAARIVLALWMLYMLSITMNTLIQLVVLLMNPVYTILGIFASAIIIYEFFIKGRQKKL